MPTPPRLRELVEHFSRELRLTRFIIEDAAHIAECMVRDKLGAGYTYTEIALVSVYIACRKGGIPVSLGELSTKFNAGRRRLSRLYRKVVSAYGLKLPHAKPEDYLLERIVPWVENKGVEVTSDDVARAVQILLVAREKSGISNARAVASAALYIALRERGKTPSEKILAQAAGVSTVTFRKYVNLLKTLVIR